MATPIQETQWTLPLGRCSNFAAYPVRNQLLSGLGAPRVHSLQMVFVQFGAGWSSAFCANLTITTIAESSAAQFCWIYYQIGSHAWGPPAAKAGRPRLSSFHTLTFLTTYTDTAPSTLRNASGHEPHSAAEGNASPMSFFFVLIYFLARSSAALWTSP